MTTTLESAVKVARFDYEDALMNVGRWGVAAVHVNYFESDGFAEAVAKCDRAYAHYNELCETLRVVNNGAEA